MVKDRVGQEIRKGDMVAHIVFGKSYSGSVVSGVVLDVDSCGTITILKVGGSKASKVGWDKVVVMRDRQKLSKVVLDKGNEVLPY